MNKKMSFRNNIVISGISGRLPKSSNIDEFAQNLLKGRNMITKNKPRIGKIRDIESFDASFFEEFFPEYISDPQLRMLLEVTYEAIVDAGINPTTLRGSCIGVFIGVASTETFDCADESKTLGCYRSMLANKISFAFDFTGPSYALDTADSSSLFALHQAVTALRNHECNAAIVAGSNLITESLDSSYLKSLIPLSKDGKCKVFDSTADGYVRAEAVVAIYLQKTKDARRIYATVIHTKTNTNGYKPAGLVSSDIGEMQMKLIHDIYKEININPSHVSYVEAHATGIRSNDVQEVHLIDEMFCQDRDTPLLIGSVKSNMGHAEAASGLCSVIKVLIAIEKGIIPANLHFNTPDQDVLASKKKRLRVVDKNTAWNGSLIGINAFGFGGTNVHVILRSNGKMKFQSTSKLHKLLAVSGCTQEAVNVLLDKANKLRDDDFISLLQAVHNSDTPKHKIRGYEILSFDNTRKLVEMKKNDTKRPIWFIFSGIGSNWLGISRKLLKYDIFQLSLSTCAKMLEPYDIDLMHIIKNRMKPTYLNIIEYFVSVVAIQIAFVDMLTSIGIYPNGMIGHSFGELCCAYCDDEEFTLEKTILAAYYMGKAILDAELEPGAMVTVRLNWELARLMCPFDISLACDDTEEMVTISGPFESITKCIANLKCHDISTEIINSCDTALHSRYAVSIASQLRASLNKIIPEPRRRSSKWISTSVPQDKWNLSLALYNSSDYYVNNLLSSVFFKEAIKHIPHNAIVVQISRHRLMSTFLDHMLPKTTTTIDLYYKYPIKTNTLLSSIGDLYVAGAQPNISKLYPLSGFPVGRGTSMIGHLIKWDHSKTWKISRYKQTSNKFGGCVEINFLEEEYAFLKGHKINGAIIFPQTACLFHVWKSFAAMHSTTFDRLPVIFENVWFQRIIPVSKEKPVKLSIVILKQTGAFEIYIDNDVITNGYIYAYSESDLPPTKENKDLTPPSRKPPFSLNSKDIYTELYLRGYEYNDVFRNIKFCDVRAITGKLYWPYEWIPYLNSVIQFSMLSSSRQLRYISHISQFIINPLQHEQLVKKQTPTSDGDWKPVLPIICYERTIKSGGTEIKGLTTISATWRQEPPANLKYEQYTFVPYEYDSIILDEQTNVSLIVLLQIVCENVTTSHIKIVEVVNKNENVNSLLALSVFDILNEEPFITIDTQVAIPSDNCTAILYTEGINIVICDAFSKPPAENVHLVIAANILSGSKHHSCKILNNLIAALKPEGFILLEEFEKNINLLDTLNYENVILVAKCINMLSREKTYILLKKVEEKREAIPVFITQNNVKWLGTLQQALQSCKENQEVLLVSQDEEVVGLIGLVNCIRREHRDVKIRYIFNQCNGSSDDPLTSNVTDSCEVLSDFYKKQLNKGLTANVYNGEWGSYRYLPLGSWKERKYTNSAYVGTLIEGNLDGLRWIESPLNYYESDQFPRDKFPCTVYYAAINKIDVSSVHKVEPSQYPSLDELAVTDDCTLGLEFSGRDTIHHDKYMGIVKTGALATTVLADSNFVWKVPDKWTLDEAATIPIAYTIGYYALFVRGGLTKGESILIHNGADHISYAAIAIALHAGCTVFITVDTQRQKQDIEENFPELTDKYISNAGNISFENFILSETQGRGVDVILNAQFKDASRSSTCYTVTQYLANGGRFLDLTNSIEMSVTSMSANNISFHSLQHCLNLLHENYAVRKRVVTLVEEGICNDVVRPLPRIVFPNSELKRAFIAQKASTTFEKVLLKVKHNEALNKPQKIDAVRRIYMNPNKSYIIIPGLDRIGLELANWLIDRGAKHILLVSDSGIHPGYQSWYVQRWRKNGINVNIYQNDITTLSDIVSMIEESQQLAPIGGIFNLAAVLIDKDILNLNEDDFESVMSINITRYLDMVPECHYSQLDYFVVFSSMSAGRGSARQCNYAFANSAMERLMEKRYILGKPGLAIQWSIEDVCFMDKKENNNDTIVSDVEPQCIRSGLETLEYFLLRHEFYPVLSSIVISKKHKPATTTIMETEL